VELTYRPAWL